MELIYPVFPLPVFIFGSIAIVLIYVIIAQLRRRSSSNKNPSKMPEKSESDLVQSVINLPRFWTAPRISTMVLGFASIVFGLEYFWTVPATPDADLLAGFAFVMGGVVLILIAVGTGTIARAKARNKFENPQGGKI